MTRYVLPLLFLLCLAPAQAFALKISPFKAALPPGGAGQVFRVENNSSEPAAVQVSVLDWRIGPDGAEGNSDAEAEFTVFPAQLVLQPHESRAVRVQWLGKDMPASEKPYRLVVEQLPVSLMGTPDTGSAVRFMLKFKAALYITPPGARSDVAVSSLSPLPDGRLRVTLVNKGTAHAVLRNPVLTLTHADGKISAMDREATKIMEGENLHAGASRYFDITGAPLNIATAHLDYEPAF